MRWLSIALATVAASIASSALRTADPSSGLLCLALVCAAGSAWAARGMPTFLRLHLMVFGWAAVAGGPSSVEHIRRSNSMSVKPRSAGRLRPGAGRRAATLTLLVVLAAAAEARPAMAQPATTAAERQADPVSAEAAVPTPAPPPASDSFPVAKPDTTRDARPAGVSPLGMFLNADPVVRAVMILLALASMATWTVLLVRALDLAIARGRLRRAIAEIRAVGSVPAAADVLRGGLPARLVAAATEELDRSAGLPSAGIKERAQAALGRIEAAAAKRAASGTGILATVGSTGPFVGLFGTVWGIMHSFIGIAQARTTNLAVVAPGIAEALLATGIGLVAAIPAVVIYNVLTRAVAAYRALVSDAVALILCHLSRDLDRRAVAGPDHHHAGPQITAG